MGSAGLPKAFTFENPYSDDYQTTKNLEIRKKPALSQDALIQCLLHLSSSTLGADHALSTVFDWDQECPYRSSLSKARKKVSPHFFRDHMTKVSSFFEMHRSTYGGLGLYAIDGHHLTLPCTADLLERGYVGRSLENSQETYTLRAYVGHCCNLLTRTTTAVTWNQSLNEHRDRFKLLAAVPDNSLVIYDRLYFSSDLLKDHQARHKVYFLARCRINAATEITRFFQSENESQKTVTIWGARLTLIKIKHPKTSEISVFVTNLPESWHQPERIADLYKMRWEIEIFQKDFMQTLHGEVWHSKSESGILQEFYSKLWLLNVTHGLMYLCGEKIKGVDEKDYLKSNFRLCLGHVVRRIKDFFETPTKVLIRLIKAIKRTREKRRKNSRSYPREIKRPQSKYTHNNTVPSSTRSPPKKP